MRKEAKIQMAKKTTHAANWAVFNILYLILSHMVKIHAEWEQIEVSSPVDEGEEIKIIGWDIWLSGPKKLD